ncbi:hotdog fold thioesterase [Flavobacteriales bacterium]|nr:hotdog fold thioesterase [Flavobacteriales bacterium]
MELASKIVNKMMSNDSFSKWLGIEIIELSEGFCKLQMKIRDDMTNGFKIAHGGITYSLADSALAFASNSNGFQSLTIESSINYFKKVNSGDILSAVTNEINKTEKIAKYSIVVSNQNNEKIASFNGKVHRTKKQWFAED